MDAQGRIHVPLSIRKALNLDLNHKYRTELRVIQGRLVWCVDFGLGDEIPKKLWDRQDRLRARRQKELDKVYKNEPQ